MRACWVMKNAYILQHKWRENVEIFFSPPSLSRLRCSSGENEISSIGAAKSSSCGEKKSRKGERRYTAAAVVVSARKMSTHCSISRAHNFSLLFTDRRKAIRKCNKTFSYENKLDDSRRLLNNFLSSPFARAPLSTLAHASHQLSSPSPPNREQKRCKFAETRHVPFPLNSVSESSALDSIFWVVFNVPSHRQCQFKVLTCRKRMLFKSTSDEINSTHLPGSSWSWWDEKCCKNSALDGRAQCFSQTITATTPIKLKARANTRKSSNKNLETSRLLTLRRESSGENSDK